VGVTRDVQTNTTSCSSRLFGVCVVRLALRKGASWYKKSLITRFPNVNRLWKYDYNCIGLSDTSSTTPDVLLYQHSFITTQNIQSLSWRYNRVRLYVWTDVFNEGSIFTYFFTLKTEAVRSPKMSVNSHQTIWCHVQGEGNLNSWFSSVPSSICRGSSPTNATSFHILSSLSPHTGVCNLESVVKHIKKNKIWWGPEFETPQT
jgi:hypothetical protein